MQFTGLLKENLWLSSQAEENFDVLKQIIKTGLTILWSREDDASLFIDGIHHSIKNNQLIFLTEFHKTGIEKITDFRVLRFNRPFYCINHNSEDDCNGILFFGAAQVPTIHLPQHETERFENLWQQLHNEMQVKDDLQIEMLRLVLKQLVIFCTRLYKEQNQLMNIEKGRLDMVRKFNSLVEMHYKTKHSVMEYAELLNKSPKTLSNLFLQYNQKTPLQIISERLMLEATRLLRYTDRTIKDITYELGFEDIQTFSRFFKTKEGVSPKTFRKNLKLNLVSG